MHGSMEEHILFVYELIPFLNKACVCSSETQKIRCLLVLVIHVTKE